MNTSHSSRAVKRVAIVAPSATKLLPLTAPLLRDLLKRRHRILCLAPDFTAPILDELADMGIECEAYPIGGHRLQIAGQIATINEITKRLKIWRPHIALNYGGADALYAAIAGHRAGVGHNVCMLTGLADIVPQDSPKLVVTKSKRKRSKTIIPRSLSFHRWRAFRSCNALILHNDDDCRILRDLNLIPHDLAVHIVPGFGVDLNHFACQPLPSLDDGLVFTMIADLQRRKGVEEFCGAARQIVNHGTTARFVLVGPDCSSHDGFTAGDIADLTNSVTLPGAVTDIRPVLKDAHVVVRPSHYGEGLPKPLLEALATGRPLITSNIGGCRNTVDERVNGCLVPPGDAQALVAAMKSFLRRPDLIASMARASRAKAERHFDVRTVNQKMIEIMQLG